MLRGDHDHLHPRRVEEADAEIEIAALRVDDRQGKPAPAVIDSEPLEDVSEIAPGMAEGWGKLGLIP